MSDLFNTGIRPAVDLYLKKKSEEQRDYGDYWSASSAGYCMRLNIMRRLGVPKVPELEDNATQTRIFESGHIFHEWMQRITKDAGLSIASEVELQDEQLMIRGHFDDLVLVKKPVVVSSTEFEMTADNPGMTGVKEFDHLILYDYKTAHSASFKFSTGRPMSHYHTMQLGTYLYMLRKGSWNTEDGKLGDFEDKVPVEEARIMSISKDDLRMHEKQLLWTPDLEKKVVEYWTTLNGYWKAKTMPKCTCLDIEGGFMGKRSAKGKIYGDFIYKNPETGVEEPCSLKWYEHCKAEGLLK